MLEYGAGADELFSAQQIAFDVLNLLPTFNPKRLFMSRPAKWVHRRLGGTLMSRRRKNL